MKTLNHWNIVKLFKVIDTKEILLLFIEPLSRGDVFNYLQDNVVA